MSVSDWAVKLGGLVLFVVGLCLLLAIVGLSVAVIHFEPLWAEALLGIAFVAGGVVLIRGGNITL